ncbi:MAG: HAMP domain-containing histidine kinase [Phycisphaerales bacterium]|nr:HAMP domain-containing histidine kinase [Phycisphaerales bacterium]MCB9836251.1 HAMP domain-containing histidine kinase [Phycisphaera sp.]
MAVSGAATYWLTERSLHKQADTALLAKAAGFASLVIDEASDMEDNDPGGLIFDYKEPLEVHDLGVWLRIESDQGETIAESPNWPGGKSANRFDERSSHGTYAISVPQHGLLHEAWLVFTPGAEQVVSEDENQPELESSTPDDELPLVPSEHRVLIRVLEPRDTIDSAMNVVGLAILLGVGFCAAGVWLIVRLGIAHGLGPLTRLAKELEATRSVEERPEMSCDTEELAPITAALTDLFDRTEAALMRERRFTDSAAHELRTPLAELRSSGEVALMSRDTGRYESSLRESVKIGEEMSNLIDSLLASTRNAKAAQDKITPITLSPILTEALRHTRYIVDTKNIELSLRIDSSSTWVAPPGSCGMIISNIVDNAIEYTPDNGHIEISLTMTESGAVLRVRNRPVSLTEDEHSRVFEPFWRRDGSRTRTGHAGLGLAVVQAQCDYAGLSLHSQLASGDWFEVIVRPGD